MCLRFCLKAPAFGSSFKLLIIFITRIRTSYLEDINMASRISSLFNGNRHNSKSSRQEAPAHGPSNEASRTALLTYFALVEHAASSESTAALISAAAADRSRRAPSRSRSEQTSERRRRRRRTPSDVSESSLESANRNRYDTSNMSDILQQSSNDLEQTVAQLRQVITDTEGPVSTRIPDSAHRYDAPPAADTAMMRLPRSRILPMDREEFAHDDTACAICCERLMDGVVITRLPCGHIYHINCAVGWLSKTCTCPECRYELPTANAKFEAKREERMEGRKVVRCDCHPSMHTCFFKDPSKGLLDQCVVIES